MDLVYSHCWTVQPPAVQASLINTAFTIIYVSSVGSESLEKPDSSCEYPIIPAPLFEGLAGTPNYLPSQLWKKCISVQFIQTIIRLRLNEIPQVGP